MEEIVNLIGLDSSPSDISDMIKNVLYTKTSEKIENIRPQISTSLFVDDFSSKEEEE